jgi:hypothetical protein
MLQEKDIAVLDDFIEIIVKERGSAVSNSMFQQLPYFENLNSDADNETERLARIIDKYDAAKVHNLDSNKNPVLQTNYNTIEFKKNGGFKKLFQEELTRSKKEKQIEVLTTQKLKWDVKLSKWQVKTFWWFFAFALAGFIYGFYDFISDLKSDKTLDKVKQSNRQLESELSKLRTLVLDQKTVDSLRSAKTQNDSLSLR